MKPLTVRGEPADGFLVGRAARMADWSFRREVREGEALIDRFRRAAWRRNNVGLARASALRYTQQPDFIARMKARRAAEALAKRATVYSCLECGATWCRLVGVTGPRPEYCSERCYQRRYQRERYRARKAAP